MIDGAEPAKRRKGEDIKERAEEEVAEAQTAEELRRQASVQREQQTTVIDPLADDDGVIVEDVVISDKEHDNDEHEILEEVDEAGLLGNGEKSTSLERLTRAVKKASMVCGLFIYHFLFIYVVFIIGACGYRAVSTLLLLLFSSHVVLIASFTLLPPLSGKEAVSPTTPQLPPDRKRPKRRR